MNKDKFLIDYAEYLIRLQARADAGEFGFVFGRFIDTDIWTDGKKISMGDVANVYKLEKGEVDLKSDIDAGILEKCIQKCGAVDRPTADFVAEDEDEPEIYISFGGSFYGKAYTEGEGMGDPVGMKLAGDFSKLVSQNGMWFEWAGGAACLYAAD